MHDGDKDVKCTRGPYNRRVIVTAVLNVNLCHEIADQVGEIEVSKYF
jgi:hypothetical protein